jgi:putative Mn2+ efflux pump MntP
MGLIELLLTAVGLSMDAFAVAVCQGLSMRKNSLSKMIVVGLYFGVFQAVMPLIGYLAGSLFSDMIVAFDHWIAFGLLVLIGAKMIVESLKKDGCSDRECPPEQCVDRTCPADARPATKEMSVAPAKMLPLALATSIDALAVGVTFAFLQVDIVPAVSFIGMTTLILSIIGVKVGSVFGDRLKSKAELIGGVILILIGLKIILEHTGVLL